MNLLRTNLVASRHLQRTCLLRQQRYLFSLPDFSSFSPHSGSEKQTYSERKIFPYKQKDLYEIVSNVSAYPTFIPYCTGSHILSTLEKDGATLMDAELTVGFMAFKESYVSKVTCTPYTSVEAVASSSTPLFKSLSTVWRFQPASPHSPHPSGSVLPTEAPEDDSGPTLVALDLSCAFASPVHAAVSSAFIGKVSGMMVEAFEDRCLKVLGRGKV